MQEKQEAKTGYNVVFSLVRGREHAMSRQTKKQRDAETTQQPFTEAS